MVGRSADLAHQAMHWGHLLTQKIATQEGEGVIIANVINLWNAFGKPVCVKNA